MDNNLLVRRGRTFGLSEEDMKEVLAKADGLSEDEIHDILDEWEVEHGIPQEMIYHGVEVIRLRGHWIEKSLISEITEAIEGTLWVFRSKNYPLVLQREFSYGLVQINLYCDNIEMCAFEVTGFRKEFDPRTEAWKYAKVDESGYPTIDTPMDGLIKELRDIWVEIVELEQNMLRISREKKGKQSSLSAEDLEKLVSLSNDNWELKAEQSIANQVLLLRYVKNPDLGMETAILGATLDDCRREIYDYWRDFDHKKEVAGVLANMACYKVDTENEDVSNYEGLIEDAYIELNLFQINVTYTLSDYDEEEPDDR